MAALSGLILISSCASIYAVPAGSSNIMVEGVPFYPQKTHQCGPASLAGVLNYRGVNTTPEEIAGSIYSQTAKGTLAMDMFLYAQREGLDAVQYAGSLADLKMNINKGNPLVVLVDYGIFFYQENHFMVVIGYNEYGIITNSGGKEKMLVPADEFLRIWEKTRFWTLLITKK